MASTTPCPFDEACDTECAQVDPGRYLELAVDPRGRKLVGLLAACEGQWLSVEDLVGLLEANGDESDRIQAALELQHRHLPRLAELGVGEYDPDRQTVRFDGCPLAVAAVDLLDRPGTN